MFWPMSSAPKTANALTRAAALHAPLPVAFVMKSMPHITCRLCFLSRGQKHQGCIGAYSHFAVPLLSRMCRASVPTLSRFAAKSAPVLCSDRQDPVLRPVPGSKNPEGAQAVKGWTRQRPPRSGAEPRTAQWASMASVLDRPSTRRENRSKKRAVCGTLAEGFRCATPILPCSAKRNYLNKLPDNQASLKFFGSR